jgi:DNA-binding XRE family transcriptional regulator
MDDGRLPITGWPATGLASLSCELKGECQMNKSTTIGKTSKSHGLPHLRNLRQRKGLSLGQLADLTGMRRDTISHLEDGRLDPQPYMIRLLARVLEVPQLDLVS